MNRLLGNTTRGPYSDPRYSQLPDFLKILTVDDIERKFNDWEQRYKNRYLPGELYEGFKPEPILVLNDVHNYLRNCYGISDYLIQPWSVNQVIVRLLVNETIRNYPILYAELHAKVDKYLNDGSMISLRFLVNPLPKYKYHERP